MKNTIAIIQSIAVLSFALILLAPLSVYFVVSQEDVSKENRELSTLPTLEFTKEYFQDVEEFFNDRLPYRQGLIAKNAKYKFEYFKVSPNADKVKIGKDGFLFINTEEAFKSYSKRDLLAPPDLETFVSKILKRDSLLTARGVAYYLGYFPNKHTVYKDKMPNSMRSQIRDTISLGKQLKYELEKNNFQFFEPSIYPERKEALRYLALDTHWSSLGGFQAYRDFFITFSELDVIPFEYEDFRWRNVYQRFGDLTKLAGVDSIAGFEEYRPLMDLKTSTHKFELGPVEDLPPKAIRTFNYTKVSPKKVLVFGDSYTTNIMPFFSLHFKEIIYLRGEYNQEMVDSLKPDLVIEVSVERFLFKHI